MTEEQKTDLPQNAASRALRVVATIKVISPIDSNDRRMVNIVWNNVYKELFGEVSPLDIVGRLRPLIQTFADVEKFIASKEIKGLVDKKNQIRVLAEEIESSALNLSGSGIQMPLNFDLLELVLEVCAQHMPEEPALGDDAQKILQELEQCREEIQNSDLDADIKEFCLRHLAEMIRALSEYGIVGGESIQQAVMSLARDVEKIPSNKKGKFPQKFKDAVRIFVGATKDINAISQFSEKVVGYFIKLVE